MSGGCARPNARARDFLKIPGKAKAWPAKDIYVQAEQGFGDSIQFARYIQPLAARAGKVTLRVHQQLVTLMRSSFSDVTVLGDRGDVEPYECDAVLLSLPRVFKSRLETIPASVPYLRAPVETIERWRRRLAGMQGVKIGAVWAGNPEQANDFRRTIELAVLGRCSRCRARRS